METCVHANFSDSWTVSFIYISCLWHLEMFECLIFGPMTSKFFPLNDPHLDSWATEKNF